MKVVFRDNKSDVALRIEVDGLRQVFWRNGSLWLLERTGKSKRLGYFRLTDSKDAIEFYADPLERVATEFMVAESSEVMA